MKLINSGLLTNFRNYPDTDHNKPVFLRYFCSMHLRILSIALVALMLYKPVLCTWTVIDFAMNKDYIAAYLCENLDRPELECQGKCYLMQKLKKQANDSAEHQAKQLTQISKMELMNTHKSDVFLFSSGSFLVASNEMELKIKQGHFDSVFHPPIA